MQFERAASGLYSPKHLIYVPKRRGIERPDEISCRRTAGRGGRISRVSTRSRIIPAVGGGGGGGGGAPVFNPGNGDTLVGEDDFNSVGTLQSMFNNAGSGNTIWPADDPSGPNGGFTSIIGDGYNGSANALRSSYPGGSQQHSAGWNFGPDSAVGNAATIHVIEYYARITFATARAESSTFGLKWLMLRHATDRIQWHSHNAMPASSCSFSESGAPYEVWQITDNSVFSDCNAWAPIGPRLRDIEATGTPGIYRRFVHRYRCNSAPGARDAIAQMWLDDVKIVSAHIDDVGIVPAGATRNKSYCDFSDLDTITSSNPCRMATFWSVYTTNTPAFTLDLGQVRRWREAGT